MPRCPAGHRPGNTDWCDVCGRPLEVTCGVCALPLDGRFCDGCGADAALPAAIAWIAPRSADVRGRPSPRPVRLDHRRLVLGRRRPGLPVPDIDLSGDRGVSARHALLVADDVGGWGVVDLGSRNGTAVGSCSAITPLRRVPVPPGTVIRLGFRTSVRIETGR